METPQEVDIIFAVSRNRPDAINKMSCVLKNNQFGGDNFQQQQQQKSR